MSPRSRRFFAWSSAVVFLVVAWQVVVYAGGWQWAGWRQGYIRSGVVVVSSSPRANLSVNGRTVGVTPKRLGRLSPGLWRLRLEAKDRVPWEHVVRVEAGQAIVIGPVTLLPTTPKITPLSPAGTILLDQDGQRAWSVELQGTTTNFVQVWPEHTNFSLPLTTAPERLAVSPHQLLTVTWAGSTTTFFSPLANAGPWEVPAIDDVWWLSSSEVVAYGRRDGQLYQFDAVTRTATLLGPALEAGSLNTDIWRLVPSGPTWNVVRQSPFGSGVPTVVTTCLTLCQVSSGPNGNLIVRETSGATSLITFSLTSQTQVQNLGTTTDVFWTSSAEPPLWINGTEIWTVDNHHDPLLLDRHPEIIRQLGWLSASHLLTVVDADALTVVSVSAKQGRGIIFHQALPPTIKTLVLGPDRHSALLLGTDLAETWKW